MSGLNNILTDSQHSYLQKSVIGKHTWKINDFDAVAAQCGVGKSIVSPTFSIDIKKDGLVQVRELKF
jgi:hypothetical protein